MSRRLFTLTEAQDALRDSIVSKYRPPAPGGGTTSAPPWVPAIVDGILHRLGARGDEATGGLFIAGKVLAWCAAGEPVHRAEQFLTLIGLLPGCELADVSDLLDRFALTRAGRDKTAARDKHVAAVRICRTWEEHDHRTKGYLDILFDGEPGPTGGTFVEVIDEGGRSVYAGDWIRRDDGLHALRIARDLTEIGAPSIKASRPVEWAPPTGKPLKAQPAQGEAYPGATALEVLRRYGEQAREWNQIRDELIDQGRAPTARQVTTLQRARLFDRGERYVTWADLERALKDTQEAPPRWQDPTTGPNNPHQEHRP